MTSTSPSSSSLTSASRTGVFPIPSSLASPDSLNELPADTSLTHSAYQWLVLLCQLPSCDMAVDLGTRLPERGTRPVGTGPRGRLADRSTWESPSCLSLLWAVLDRARRDW